MGVGIGIGIGIGIDGVWVSVPGVVLGIGWRSDGVAELRAGVGSYGGSVVCHLSL